MKIRHIGIVCLEINTSLKFWRNYFNFKIIKKVNEKGQTINKILGFKNAEIKTIKLKNETGLILELILFQKPKTKKKKLFTNNNGITHFALTVKNLDNFYKKYNKTINFNCPPQFSEDGKVKVLYAKTPEGCFIELVEEIKKDN